MKKLVLLLYLLSFVSYSLAYNVEQTQKDTNLDLHYPLVYLDNATAQKNINTDIAQIVEESKDAYYNRGKHTVKLVYQIMYENDTLLSILFEQYFYTPGSGILGIKHENYGFVYDKHTGKKIPLSYFVRINNIEQIQFHLHSGLLKVIDAQGNSYKNISNLKLPNYISDQYYLYGDGSVYLIYPRSSFTGPTMFGTSKRIIFSKDTIDYFNRMNK